MKIKEDSQEATERKMLLGQVDTEKKLCLVFEKKISELISK